MSTKGTYYYSLNPDREIKYEVQFDEAFELTRMAMTGDGRKRGLWFWMADRVEVRRKREAPIFQEGVEQLEKWLKDPEGYAKHPENLSFMIRSNCFEYFFAHRYEAQGVRLSWAQAKEFHKALGKALKDPDQREY